MNKKKLLNNKHLILFIPFILFVVLMGLQMKMLSVYEDEYYKTTINNTIKQANVLIDNIDEIIKFHPEYNLHSNDSVTQQLKYEIFFHPIELFSDKTGIYLAVLDVNLNIIANYSEVDNIDEQLIKYYKKISKSQQRGVVNFIEHNHLKQLYFRKVPSIDEEYYLTVICNKKEILSKLNNEYLTVNFIFMALIMAFAIFILLKHISDEEQSKRIKNDKIIEI